MSDLPEKPLTRKEQLLSAIAGANEGETLPEPVTREEQYLKYIAENGSGGGEVTPTQVREIIAEQTDDEISSTSENPVQNKVVKAYVDNAIASITDYESEVFPNA